MWPLRPKSRKKGPPGAHFGRPFGPLWHHFGHRRASGADFFGSRNFDEKTEMQGAADGADHPP